jgi:ATP-dependent exoDNAse (exonuclease V) beta subunit
MNLRIISAGAGSGKTYRLTEEMTKLLQNGVRASGIIATTFTKKAAAELQERVRVKLLSEGRSDQADELANALIGTVHGLGVRLLQRFAFEAGVSPEVDIIAEEDQQTLFNLALSNTLQPARVERMEALSERMGLNKRGRTDWRGTLLQLTEIARSNDFSAETLRYSKVQSFATFQPFIGEAVERPYEERLAALLKQTIATLEHNEDSTKVTQTAVNTLRGMSRQLELQGQLNWYDWAKISKLKVGAKSRDDAAELLAFAYEHYQHPGFHRDVEDFIGQLFDLAIDAMEEYDQYKKRRGLIDYTDMEVLVNRLLNREEIREVLASEIDLLMVDEFQDTSPIQLEIFLKLSRIATHSVWVGDPKQSIYGFRGAEPELMQAIIRQQGGVKPDDIQSHSWRSREEIVLATNALFTKAFPELPEAQVALKPKRCRDGSLREDCLNEGPEPAALQQSLMHWHFRQDEGKRPPGKPWMEDCLADTLHTWLQRKVHVHPKGSKTTRPAQAGDVAILCRSNHACQEVAEALHRAGLRAAIARSGLMATAEARLILACLKYLLNQYDALSIAEILLLASSQGVEAIIEDRLGYLAEKEKTEGQNHRKKWGEEDAFIQSLNDLRPPSIELSSAETLDLLLEELDLRPIIASWGNERQRLSNVDMLRRYALQYEEACNRLHTAASTGGFLLWLAELENSGKDMQGSGEGPEAVNVLTYHRSKGLEWPVVICHDLENRLRADVWGLTIVSEAEEVDLDHVLGQRWLRYWVNPYADQYRGTYLAEQLEECEANKIARQQALAEEARLLYVGITRARDYLVFPTRLVPTRWLNRVWHQGEEDFPTLDADSSETPWEWEGQFLDIATEVFTYGRDFTHSTALEPQAVPYLDKRKGRESHEGYYWLEDDVLPQQVEALALSLVQYTGALQWPEGADRYDAAKALKALFVSDHLDYPTAERREMAQGYIERYTLEDTRAEDLLEQSMRWQQWMAQQFSAQRILRKYPIRHHFQGRQFETIVDWVLETEEGMVLLQNSGYDQSGQEKLKNHALSQLWAWAYLSQKGLQALFGKRNVRCFIHYVMAGAVVELQLNEMSAKR